MPDHVDRWIAIPPKQPVASVIGFLKGNASGLCRVRVFLTDGIRNGVGSNGYRAAEEVVCGL